MRKSILSVTAILAVLAVSCGKEAVSPESEPVTEEQPLAGEERAILTLNDFIADLNDESQTRSSYKAQPKITLVKKPLLLPMAVMLQRGQATNAACPSMNSPSKTPMAPPGLRSSAMHRCWTR